MIDIRIYCPVCKMPGNPVAGDANGQLLVCSSGQHDWQITSDATLLLVRKQLWVEVPLSEIPGTTDMEASG